MIMFHGNSMHFSLPSGFTYKASATLFMATITMALYQADQSSSHQSMFHHPAAGQILMEGLDGFTLELHKQLSRPLQNAFFSPLSISMAMAMTYMGARGNTARQMKSALGFTEVEEQYLHGLFQDLRNSIVTQNNTYVLHIANRLYGQQGSNFRQEFIERTRYYYGAEMQRVDFGDDRTRNDINRWVEKQTNNKIVNILPSPLHPLTRLILVNAIYFKGDWAKQFDADLTEIDTFTKSNGEKMPVDMMYLEHVFAYSQIEDLNCEVLGMPFEGHDVTMFILLPWAHNGLSTVEAALTPQHIKKIAFRGHRRHNQYVRLYLPRFRLEQMVSLRETLSELGMPDAFDSGTADFSGMDGTRDLFVSDVKHKAFIEINEEGGEAAAATVAIEQFESYPPVEPEMIEFRADHPFLFFIRDRRSGSILFMGKLEEPSPATGGYSLWWIARSNLTVYRLMILVFVLFLCRIILSRILNCLNWSKDPKKRM